MAEAREIRCYQYVNRPYAKVSELLAGDPVGLFQRATTAAAERAESLVANLKVSIAGLEVGKDVRIEVTRVDPKAHSPGALVSPATAVELRWRAATNAAFFPSMRAELVAYPLSGEETQLDLRGWYEPPGGLLGTAADALVGHRVAEASIHRFLDDVAKRISIDAG